MRRGQSTLEYIYLIGIVAAALIAAFFYIHRGFQGNLRSNAEQLSAWQYNPGNTGMNSHEIKTVNSASSFSSTVTVKYGGSNNSIANALEKQEKLIESKEGEIDGTKTTAGLKHTFLDWAFPTYTEAKDRAAYIRNVNIYENFRSFPASNLTNMSKSRDNVVSATDELNKLIAKRNDLEDKLIKSRTPNKYSFPPPTTSENSQVAESKNTDETLGDL